MSTCGYPEFKTYIGCILFYIQLWSLMGFFFILFAQTWLSEVFLSYIHVHDDHRKQCSGANGQQIKGKMMTTLTRSKYKVVVEYSRRSQSGSAVCARTCTCFHYKPIPQVVKILMIINGLSWNSCSKWEKKAIL